ncbi:hypothetical protein [Streptomyces sp. ActVer]|uniref:hypothetical protein n=1 Tax=Streptomyces sp. ActVer TaxID=3014558 RepID=UPI0022B43E86|nr:hypothetical protein [Streptomyces sp. ActVer]
MASTREESALRVPAVGDRFHPAGCCVADTTTATPRSARLVAEAVAGLAVTGRYAAAVDSREPEWV